MARDADVHFENIESAHAYVGLLGEAIDDAARMIAEEMDVQSNAARGRNVDALRLIDYKLHALREHMLASRRLLGDLRTLRRYLLNERTTERDLKSRI